MKEYQAEQIRNIGLFSHGGAGKTSLAEAMLFQSGAINRLGRVEEGSTTTDHDPDEIKRRISVSSALAPCEWQGNKVNMVDDAGLRRLHRRGRPGHASGGRRGDRPGCRLRPGGGHRDCLARGGEERRGPHVLREQDGAGERQLRHRRCRPCATRFGPKVVPIQIPVGSQATFQGVVDLISMKP